MSVAIPRPLNDSGGIPSLDDILKDKINHDVEGDEMVVWDKGVFLNELHRQGIVLATSKSGAINGGLAARTGLKQGTYKGTQLALTEIYNLIEQAYDTPFPSSSSNPGPG
jgi:hypothetical protein